MPKDKLYIEDLRIGMILEGGTVAVTEAEIVEFAKKFDPQPFHTDPAAAESTIFNGLAASGWHTMALTMRMLVESVPLAGGIIGFGGEIGWPRPVRPRSSRAMRWGISPPPL